MKQVCNGDVALKELKLFAQNVLIAKNSSLNGFRYKLLRKLAIEDLVFYRQKTGTKG